MTSNSGYNVIKLLQCYSFGTTKLELLIISVFFGMRKRNREEKRIRGYNTREEGGGSRHSFSR